MPRVYVLEGPAGCGNAFGFYQEDRLAAGKFAVVRDGEYANGGHGPSTVDGRRYDDHDSAAAAAAIAEAAIVSHELEGKHSVLVTVGPTSGRVSNVTWSHMTVAEATAWCRKHDRNNCISVYSLEEWAALPRCAACGHWHRLGYCSECR